MRATPYIKSGFTMLEVVISLALFALGVSVLSSAYINVLNSLDRLQVDQHLEQDMALIRRVALMIGEIDEFEKGGEVPTANYGMVEWRGEYEETLIADLFKVTLTVFVPDEEEREEQEITQVLYLTRPNWSDPVEREKLREDSRERFEREQLRRDRS
ncbi:prepilin-type N-terminal cleavage/methylation domain-containing protein [Puniceicoccaceae bacterium K14]|nr:prepilin-type N-terminal cleavage/methylation domain-containing protein [Puniceicoccaceae bacterium K14]